MDDTVTTLARAALLLASVCVVLGLAYAALWLLVVVVRLVRRLVELPAPRPRVDRSTRPIGRKW